jgi:hypothetical protein
LLPDPRPICGLIVGIKVYDPEDVGGCEFESDKLCTSGYNYS